MAQLDISWLFSWWKPVNKNPPQGAEELLNLCKELISKAEQRLGSKRDGGRYLMNRHQCDFLVKRLLETHGTLEDYQQLKLDLNEIPVLQELHQALVNADRLIQSSCIPTLEWLRGAIEQGDMNETFSQILYDVQWHKSVLQSILVDKIRVSGIISEPALCYGELTKRDKLGLGSATKEDEQDLKTRLRSEIKMLHGPIEQVLAIQLLKKMEAFEDQRSTVSVEDSSGVGLVPSSSLNLLFLNPHNLNDYYSGTLLGKGSYAEVRETTLLGGNYAIKIFEQHRTHSFDQEVAALQGLGHHPHIVRLLCYSRNNSKCFLIMEKMDKDLNHFLDERKYNAGKLSNVEAVVLMLQIAEGVRYIHSKHMAHRDLKPGNVLVNVDPSRKLLARARSVKIADFGLSKTKNASIAKADHSVNTGTPRYMAPEVINAPGIIAARGDSDRTELIPKKADVYSFAIMSSEILTGKSAFENLGNNELKTLVKAGDRPNLPEECPEQLASLIRRCWVEDLKERPDFDKICVELRDIKGLLLQGEEEKSQTKDVPGKSRFNVQERQETERTSSQATSPRSLRFLYEQSTRLFEVPRVNGSTQTPRFLVVLVIMLLLLLFIGVVAYHRVPREAKHQVPREASIGDKERNQFSIVAASTKGIKQGPWGRAQPSKVTGLFDHKADSIKAIFLKYDPKPPGIGLLVVKYVNPDGKEFRESYCDNIVGRQVIKIEFETHEYIRQISGSVAPYYVSVGKKKAGLISVVSLTIHTNLRSYGPFGDEVGHKFRSGTGKVIGFFGAAGAVLDKLGVWIIPDGQDDGDPSFLLGQ